jgi:hypothetical protein
MFKSTSLLARASRNVFGVLLSATLGLLSAGPASTAHAVPITPADLENWSTDPAPISHKIGVGGPVAHETMGVFCFTRTGTVYQDLGFVGDFEFHTKFRVDRGANYDGALGVLFGYTDENNHYRFTWDGFNPLPGTNVGTGLGYPDNPGNLGPTFKNVTTLPAAMNPAPGVYGIRLIKEVNGVNTVLFHEAAARSWLFDTNYEIWITRTGNDVHFKLMDLTNALLVVEGDFSDGMYLNGSFGLFSEKLRKLNYFDTDIRSEPVPEPSSMVLAALGGLALVGIGRRRRCAVSV